MSNEVVNEKLTNHLIEIKIKPMMGIYMIVGHEREYVGLDITHIVASVDNTKLVNPTNKAILIFPYNNLRLIQYWMDFKNRSLNEKMIALSVKLREILQKYVDDIYTLPLCTIDVINPVTNAIVVEYNHDVAIVNTVINNLLVVDTSVYDSTLNPTSYELIPRSNISAMQFLGYNDSEVLRWAGYPVNIISYTNNNINPITQRHLENITIKTVDTEGCIVFKNDYLVKVSSELMLHVTEELFNVLFRIQVVDTNEEDIDTNDLQSDLRIEAYESM